MSCYQTVPFRMEEDIRQFIKEAREPFIEINQKSEEKNKNNKNEKMMMIVF